MENIAYVLSFIILPLMNKQRVRTEIGTLENIFSCLRNVLAEFLTYPAVCASWRIAQMLRQKLDKLPPLEVTRREEQPALVFSERGKEETYTCILSLRHSSRASETEDNKCFS